jgi:hypothetical protein
MSRLVNPDFDPEVSGEIYIPTTQGSRIPDPVERQLYEGPSSTPAQPDSFTSPTNMGCGHGRHETPRRFQQYNIPAPTFNRMTLSPRDCQCPTHCTKKRSSTVPKYPVSLAPSSSGMWHVLSPSDSRRSAIASSPVPRGIMKTAEVHRCHRHQ